MQAAEILLAAREGVAAEVERFARLLKAQPSASTPIPGSQWTVRDAAVHLAGANHRHIAYANGDAPAAATLDKADLDARSRSQIDENPETDAGKLAGQIRDGFDRLRAVTATIRADRLIAYHAGLRPTFARLTCFLLGEYLLHGYDVACALRAPWPIDPGQAALAVGAYRMALPHLFQPRSAAELQATYHVDVAGTDPFFLRVDGGTCEEVRAPLSVDCSLSADSVTALLVLSGRLSQWPAVALGRLAFSGRRPEIGRRFTQLFLFP